MTQEKFDPAMPERIWVDDMSGGRMTDVCVYNFNMPGSAEYTRTSAVPDVEALKRPPTEIGISPYYIRGWNAAIDHIASNGYLRTPDTARVRELEEENNVLKLQLEAKHTCITSEREQELEAALLTITMQTGISTAVRVAKIALRGKDA